MHISNEIVPDLATANMDDLSIWDFIFSSAIAPQFLKPSLVKRFFINWSCSEVEWNTNSILVYFSLIKVLKNIQPDVRILGADHKGTEFTGHDLPIKCIFNSRDHGFSTSELRQRVYLAEKEIDSYKSKIEDQIIQIESELEKAIAAAKAEGEKLVDSNVEEATKKANAETQKTIEEAKTKSKDIASQITAQNAQDIINILLKGVE